MTEEIPVSITGYGDTTTAGAVRVQSYDRRARLRRAGAGLALWWAVALATAFIPVAHFLLVPGFGAFGLFVCYRRVGAERVILDFRGTCPDCETEQTFDVDDRWSPPFALSCGQCGRGLKARIDRGSN